MCPHTLSTQPQSICAPVIPDIPRPSIMNVARGKLISLTVSLSDRASGSTVGSRRLGLRGFGSGEGVETEQADKVDILTEESVRMSYMVLGDPTGNSTAWCVWIRMCRRGPYIL